MNNIGHYLKYSLIKNIFLFAKDSGFNMEDFINKFMNSEIARKIFLYSNDHFYNEKSVVLEFVSEINISKKGNKFDEILVSYFALIFVNFYLETGELPKKIIKNLPIQYIVDNFDHFHLLDEKQVIEIALNDFNKRNNALRKQRSSNNALDLNIFKNTELLFLSKHIYRKLYPYLFLDDFEYKCDDFSYLESEKNVLMCFIAKKLIDVSNVIKDENLEKYAFRKSNAIKVIFVDESIKLTENIINKIGSQIPLGSFFSKTMLITKQCCFVFNAIGEYEKYYFVFTNKDKSKINLEYKERFMKLMS